MERLLQRMIRLTIHIFVVSIMESGSPAIGIITVMGISWTVTKYQALH